MHKGLIFFIKTMVVIAAVPCEVKDASYSQLSMLNTFIHSTSYRFAFGELIHVFWMKKQSCHDQEMQLYVGSTWFVGLNIIV